MGKNEHTWVIKNFSASRSGTIYSDEFVISGCKWRLKAYPSGEWFRNFMSLFLYVPHSKSLPSGWRRRTKLRMSVVNQYCSKIFVLKESTNWFDQQNPVSGFKTMISRTQLLSKTGGFLVDGQVKIVVRIDVLKVIRGVDVSQATDESEEESEEESEDESEEESENESEDISEVASRPRKKTKLNDDDEVSGDFDNETQQVKEFMSVYGFQVFPSPVNVVSRIFGKYPDMASDFQAKSPHMRTAFINVLLSLVETLRQAPLKLSDKDLLEADNAFAYIKDSGFKVDWLGNKLKDVKKKKREEETSATRMRELEKELKDVKQKYSNTVALLKKEKGKLVAVRARPTSIKDKPSMDLGSKSKNGVKRSNEGQTKSTLKLMEESSKDKENELGDTLCGSCGGNDALDEFWICCDVCERWYHGRCVKITPARAESIKQYKCPSCCNEKGTP